MDMTEVSPETTGDERLLLLAMALDTRAGVAFEDVVQSGLLGQTDAMQRDSVRHAFNVARRQLAELGLNVVEVDYGSGPRYKLDARTSFADPHDIDLAPDEALMLVTLLSLSLDNSAALWAPDALRARDKLAEALGLDIRALDDANLPGGLAGASGAGAVGAGSCAPAGGASNPALALSPDERAQGKLFNQLMKAYADRRPVAFDYTRTDGEQSRKRVCVYGAFERAEFVYIVGLDVTDAPSNNEAGSTVKTFRLDRIGTRGVKVDTRATYEVPVDFSTSDYLILPFSYGPDPARVAIFRAAEGRTPESFESLTLGKGTWVRDAETDAWFWHIEVRNVDAAARWAVEALAQGLVPVEDTEIRAALARGLARSEALHA